MVVSGDRSELPAIRVGRRRVKLPSGSAPVVVLEHATKPFTAFDLTCDDTNILIRLDAMVAQALMISLGMIVLDVFTNCVLK